MKKWMTSLCLGAYAFSLAGCTSAVMVYVRTQRVHHGYLIERTRDQVRTCLGQPNSVQHINGVEMWHYSRRTSPGQICQVNIYFKGKKVKDTNFSEIGSTRQKAASACDAAKEAVRPCLKRYLMVHK